MTTNVFAPHRLRRLFAADAVNIARDPTLLYVVVLSVLPALAGFFFRDALNSAVESNFGLAGVFEMILPMLLCLPAFLLGWVTGFLFLEERDDGPLLAVDTTPVGKRGLMAYRIATAATLTFAMTLFACALLLPERGIAVALAVAVMVAADAVCVALVLPALARNKVEGLALIKVANVFAMAPLLALVPGAWRFAGGLVPTFWIGELILNAPDFPDAGFLLAAGAGIATHLLVVWLFFRLQARRAG